MNLDPEMSRYLVLDEESIRVALQKIDHNDEGVVVCVDTTGLLIGILTDGDLRRWLVTQDSPDIDQPVRSVINQNPVWARLGLMTPESGQRREGRGLTASSRVARLGSTS